MTKLRLGLVSAYPPSTAPLSEYAWHLVTAVSANERVGQVCVLADRAAGATRSVEGARQVIPCWTFGSPFLATSILRAARSLKLDALWFNIHMTSTGNTRASWFGGVCAPAVARAAGFKVIVTLHNMLGMTDLEEVGVNARPWDIAAAHVVTRSLACAHAVCVLRPEYVPLLTTRYGISNVFYLPHGTLGEPATAPASNDGTHVLAFGHFGSYKRLEPLIDAVAQLSLAGVPVRLSIAGSDSRHSPGYLQQLERLHRTTRNVRFLGYVPEAQVPALFESAAVCVLPYATMAGMSGVAVLAAMHGVPLVVSDIAPFRALEREGLQMRFFRWPDAESLAGALEALLSVPDDRQRLALHNLAFIRKQQMPAVATAYLGLIESILSANETSIGSHLQKSSAGVNWDSSELRVLPIEADQRSRRPPVLGLPRRLRSR